MNNFIKYIKRNWSTITGGVVAILPQLPQYILSAGFKPDPQVQKWFNLISIIGTGWGILSAKAGTNHSTVDEVHTSTAQAIVAGQDVSQTAKSIVAPLIENKTIPVVVK